MLEIAVSEAFVMMIIGIPLMLIITHTPALKALIEKVD